MNRESMTPVLAALAMLLLSRAGECATPAWAEEPSSIFGITLGEPFPSAGEIPDCPLFAPFRREPQYEGMCVDAREGFSADHVLLRNVPLSGLADEARVTLEDGRVVAVAVSFDAIEFEPMKELLVQRYGAAHDHHAAPSSAEKLAWRGTRVAILLARHDGDTGAPRLEFRSLSPR